MCGLCRRLWQTLYVVNCADAKFLACDWRWWILYDCMIEHSCIRVFSGSVWSILEFHNHITSNFKIERIIDFAATTAATLVAVVVVVVRFRSSSLPSYTSFALRNVFEWTTTNFHDAHEYLDNAKIKTKRAETNNTIMQWMILFEFCIQGNMPL